MENSINQLQILSPSDVCTLLQIKESTLRKYAILLKDVGYHFDENERGQRAYYEKDVIAFKKLIEIKNSHDMTLEQSANAVMTWLEQSSMSLNVMIPKRQNESYDNDIKAIKDLLHEVVKKLDQQQEQNEKLQQYIETRFEEELNHRKNDRELVSSLKESMETQKLIAVAQEEEKKKGFFSRLFGR